MSPDEDVPRDRISAICMQLRLIAHADWSKNPVKCWMAVAAVQPDGKIDVLSLSKIGPVEDLLQSLETISGKDGCAMIGFDFPIGLPYAYAQSIGVANFIHILPCFGSAEWIDFYTPAESSDQLSIHRPFYPNNPGNAKRAQLTSALNLEWKDMYRQCELAHNDRRSACPLFWTLGGQQVGKAAIHGWRDVLAPAMRDGNARLAIWPFSGELENLIRPGAIIAVETYPAEFFFPLDIRFSTRQPGTRSGKRQQSDRRVNASAILNWCNALSIQLSKDIEAQVLDGFGAQACGEDAFDAMVGLLGMVKALHDWDRSMEPEGHQLRNIEGWIFGQKPYSKAENIGPHEQP